MDVRTARLGPLETLEVPDEAGITFPAGLPGFEEHTDFALLEDPYYAPFCWLQALGDPRVSFLLVPPTCVAPGYELELTDEDRASLELADEAVARLYCIVVVPPEVRSMTANLKAPVVINPARRRGKQVIRTDEWYGLRCPVLTGATEMVAVQSC